MSLWPSYCRFPGRHDDQVDALSQGLAWHRESWKPPLVQRRAIGLGCIGPRCFGAIAKLMNNLSF